MEMKRKNRSRRRGTLGLFLAACLLSCAMSEGYVLPESLTSIEEEAFSGTPALREVTIPETLETDFSEAFPEADETIWIHCAPGDLAGALLNAGRDVDARTVYRALLIGQTYPDSGNSSLEGPGNDVTAMRLMLSHLSSISYQTTERRNITAEGILSAIQSAFGEASEYDVSLFYYSGHGRRGGYLVGCENGKQGGGLSPTALRNALNQIPGRKVILIDACYSGGYLEEEFGSTTVQAPQEISLQAKGNSVLPSQSGKEDEEALEEQEISPVEFNAFFLNAFTQAQTGKRGLRSADGSSGYSAYYVMTAAAAQGESYEGTFSVDGQSAKMGLFTYYLCKGCGWNGVTGGSVNKSADTNGDQLVTFGEAFSYAKREAARTAAPSYNQDAQSNAADLQSFSPFR